MDPTTLFRSLPRTLNSVQARHCYYYLSTSSDLRSAQHQLRTASCYRTPFTSEQRFFIELSGASLLGLMPHGAFVGLVHFQRPVPEHTTVN